MRIQYISDIHLEFYNSLPEKLILKPEAEVLCLAGDIGFPYSTRYEEFLVRMSKIFKKVFIITGNHEYYNAQGNRHHTMEEIDDRIRQIISSYSLLNVTYLDNEYEDYEGYRFVGSTLWSKCEVPIVEHCINDFRAIKEMSVDLYNSLHEISREFLKSEVVTASPLPVIVMTHHLPSYKLIDRKYINENKNLNKYFASDSDDLFVPTIMAWIYGHTHTGSVKEGHGIKFYCNPYGYPGENEEEVKISTFEV
jgi:predicted phosphodiesterase